MLAISGQREGHDGAVFLDSVGTKCRVVHRWGVPHTHNVAELLSLKLYWRILLCVSAAYTTSELGCVAIACSLMPSQLAITDPSRFLNGHRWYPQHRDSQNLHIRRTGLLYPQDRIFCHHCAKHNRLDFPLVSYVHDTSFLLSVYGCTPNLSPH